MQVLKSLYSNPAILSKAVEGQFMHRTAIPCIHSQLGKCSERRPWCTFQSGPLSFFLHFPPNCTQIDRETQVNSDFQLGLTRSYCSIFVYIKAPKGFNCTQVAKDSYEECWFTYSNNFHQ